MDDLDRTFHRLSSVIRAEYPEYLDRPFEVGDLYQTLIPYRHHRRELELETNQDYELALTRLLAGERGYLRVDERMQERLRQELASSHPDTAAFRAFNTAKVAIAPDAANRLAASASASGASAHTLSPTPQPAAMPPAAMAQATLPQATTVPAAPVPEYAAPAPRATPSVVPTMAPVPMPMPGPGPRGADSFAFPSPAERPMERGPERGSQDRPAGTPSRSSAPVSAATRAPAAIVAHGDCHYCGGELPDGRRITFCPHCGQNLTVQHCPACSTELAVGWKFCTTCGRGTAQP